MKLAIIVATTGRLEYLTKLLGSLEGQLLPGDHVVVSAQGRYLDVVNLVAGFKNGLGSISVVASYGGISRGRNEGVRALNGIFDYVLFPNDSSSFETGFLERFRTSHLTGDAGAFSVVDEKGPKFVLPMRGTGLTRENVWLVIEPGLFVRHSTFMELSGFDVALGTGAPSAWQSGEGTDFLLRLMRRSLPVSFDWLPNLALLGISDSYALSHRQRRRKLRAYGRGYGRVVRLHHYPFSRVIRMLIGGASFGIRKGRPYLWSDGLSVLTGRVEGLLGVTLGGPPPPSLKLEAK